jgi:hypothetical protein
MAVGAAGALKAGRDSKKAAKAAARASIVEAMHRKKVAEYNATVLREQATRYRNEMVNRLKESSSINVGRLTEDLDINTFRLNEAYNLNISRLSQDTSRDIGRIDQDTSRDIGRIDQDTSRDTFRVVGDAATDVSRTQEDALLKSARTQEVADTTVRRLERDAAQQVVYGSEDENQIRRLAAETISSTRAFYGARNIVIDSGTPAALQVDAARMGEVDALRVRRNYRIKAEALLENAADIKRDALWQIGDINRVAAYSITDIRKETGRNLEDIFTYSARERGDILTAAGRDKADLIQSSTQTSQDLTRNWGYNTSDTKRVTEQQLADIGRNLGYDLSDTEYEATKLDQQAALVILQGDADMAAGLNRADAYKTAGDNAMTQGILNAAGSVISQVDPKWLQRSTPAPVSTSQPTYVRP